jgi:hypothetical protein
MIYRKRRMRTSVPRGFYRFEDRSQRTVSGFGDGDFIRLRDEYGNTWRGQAELQDDCTIHFRFRDSNGKVISGISDHYGILLRDELGNSWRGYVD